MTRKLLRPEEVAELLNISKSYIYKLLRLRSVPAIRIGRSIRIRPEDLEKFIRKNAQTENESEFDTNALE